jgi:hypothetical protein
MRHRQSSAGGGAEELGRARLAKVFGIFLMYIFGKKVRDYFVFVRTGLLLIVAMGVARFTVGASGVSYVRATHLVSLTILTFLLAIIYGQRVASRRFGGYRHLIPLTLLLSFTMYGFILLAITVEGLTGIGGYFHAPGSGYAPAGMELVEHIVGQLSVLPIMTISILGVSILGYVLSRHIAYLRNAFLLMAAMAVLRFLAGALGVPYGVGSWATSITLLSLALAAYYGYRAPSRGFNGYAHMVLVGVMVGFVVLQLVAYGIAVTEGLGVSSYFHAPGVMQPAGITVTEQIVTYVKFSAILAVFLTLLASVGFALGKSKGHEFARRSR